MANTMDDTLSGAVKRLGSAWEGFILDMNEGAGASAGLKDAIDFLAENLTEIMGVILSLVNIWIKYQIVIKTTALTNRLMNSQFITMGRNMGGLKGAVRGLSGAFKQLGNAIKSNLLGLAVLVLTDMFFTYQKLNGIIDKTAENQRDLNRAVKDAEKNYKKEAKELTNVFGALKKNQ